MDRIQKAAIKFKNSVYKNIGMHLEMTKDGDSYLLYNSIILDDQNQVLNIMFRFKEEFVQMTLYMPDCMYDYDLAEKEMKKLSSIFTMQAGGYENEPNSLAIKSWIPLEFLEDYTEVMIIKMNCMAEVLSGLMNTKKPVAS